MIDGLKSLRPKSMNSSAPPKIILSAGRYPNQRGKHLHYQCRTWQTGHLAAATERPVEPLNNPCPGAVQLRHGKMSQTCEMYWRIKQGKQDRSMDRADARWHVMIFTPDTINPTGPNTAGTALPSCVVTQP